MKLYRMIFRRPGEAAAVCVDDKEKAQKAIKAFLARGYEVEVRYESND